MQMTTKLPLRDLAAIVVCTFAWGTTWYAITWQLGHVDPIVSVTYRFALASMVLFVWCGVRGEAMRLSPSQHLAALGVGFFTFAIDYAFVYWAEERVTSAVVAVMFATLSFINLIVFRFAFKQRAPRTAWIAAGLGTLGVVLLSWSELLHANMDRRAITGLAMALTAVVGAAFGNVFARRGEEAGAPLAASTAWSMAYGSLLLAAYALVTDRAWAFDARWPYMISLLYLALMGSVVAFLLYYGLARRRGYSTASYISALTPLLAMTVSSIFEGKHWGRAAIGGVALVIVGQWLLLRTRKT
jgi:drug/metabolite transporter (DMT)-like permease